MTILADIMQALDRIPVWKRLQAVPAEVDDLKTRVAELEQKLSGKYPPDVCKFCGERAARLNAERGPHNGKVTQSWRCESCGKFETRIV
jgi:uncharacterized protein with PIN domain